MNKKIKIREDFSKSQSVYVRPELKILKRSVNKMLKQVQHDMVQDKVRHDIERWIPGQARNDKKVWDDRKTRFDFI